MAFGFYQDGPSITADAGVDDRDVDGAFGEVAPGLFQQEGTLVDGVWRHFVGDVYYGGCGCDCGDDALNDTYEMVCRAEVGEECDHRYSVE